MSCLNSSRSDMNSTSAMFDFSNEGDNIIANENLKPKDNDVSCEDKDFTFSYLDLLTMSAIYDQLLPDIEMTEQQMSQLRKQDKDKINIKPFVDIIDLNESDKDLVNEIKPNPAIVIGIKGEF